MAKARRPRSKPKKKEPEFDGTLSNLQFLKVSFREGLGMFEACRLTGNTPKNVTLAMEADPKLREEIEKAVRACNLDQLKKVSELREAGKYKEAEAIVADLGTQHSLVTWGMFGTAKDLSTEKFMAAYPLVRSAKDMAVGFAVEYDEYVHFINTNSSLIAAVDGMIRAKLL